MSLSADYLLDRRRLGRALTFWRAAAFVALAIAIVALGFRFVGIAGAGGPHIAKFAISGVIVGDEDTLRRIRDIADSNAVAAILTIDSPGGTTEGSELLYQEIRRLAAKKPVVATVGALGASGAYIAALAADRILVHDTTLIGSIGVLVQFPNFTGLMDKVGVKLESIKSSPLKAAPNGMEPTSEEARAATAALVADSYAWFKDLVKERRHMSDDELAKVDDGRVFTGRQSLPLKLADAIGGERDAVEWLQSAKGVAKDLKVRDWTPKPGFSGWRLTSLAADLASAFGLRNVAQALLGGQYAGLSSIDGLLSIWQ